jgi:hypothetical protein
LRHRYRPDGETPLADGREDLHFGLVQGAGWCRVRCLADRAPFIVESVAQADVENFRSAGPKIGVNLHLTANGNNFPHPDDEQARSLFGV